MSVSRKVMMMQSVVADLERARAWSRSLEDREMNRSGVLQDDARKAVARRAGVPSGTLENLRNGRLKAVATHVFRRLHAAVVADLEQEIARLEHELACARACGLDLAGPEVSEVEAYLSRARQALGRLG